jgi:hypothetical protein
MLTLPQAVECLVYAGTRAYNNTLDARSRDIGLENFESGMFYTAVSIAHELVHQFVRYLCGIHVVTPEPISTPWAAPSIPGAGESGWNFEALVLGDGQLAILHDPDSSLGGRQCGKLYYTPRNSNAATRVSRRYIQDMLLFSMSSMSLIRTLNIVLITPCRRIYPPSRTFA